MGAGILTQILGLMVQELYKLHHLSRIFILKQSIPYTCSNLLAFLLCSLGGAARGPFSTTKIMSQVNHLAKVPALKSFVIGHTKQTT